MTNEPQGKIEVTIGRVVFSGEGTQDWLAEQLNKVLEAAKNQSASSNEPEVIIAEVVQNDPTAAVAKKVGSLANYLKSNNATTSQVRRFLTTAGWLVKRGNSSLKTGDVTKALKDNQQSRIGNPADALNQNVSKGFCEKTSDGFFITPEGWEEIGDSV